MTRSPLAIRLCITAILIACLQSLLAAEDDVLLLTIEGNLIGLTEPFDGEIADRGAALRLANAYHRLLPEAALSQIEPLHAELLRLIPDFQVAYAAADSAEITDVMSEIDACLAAMQEIYAQEYTSEVIELLSEAYQLILPTFGDE